MGENAFEAIEMEQVWSCLNQHDAKMIYRLIISKARNEIQSSINISINGKRRKKIHLLNMGLEATALMQMNVKMDRMHVIMHFKDMVM
jgi:hypothetical protein